MATIEEVKAKLAEYEEARNDRIAKQEQHDADTTALQTAVDAESVSREAWIAALQHEHAVEDAFEALVVAHEPPALPETT